VMRRARRLRRRSKWATGTWTRRAVYRNESDVGAAIRASENAAVFDFSLGDGRMARLDALDEGLTTGWDPAHQS